MNVLRWILVQCATVTDDAVVLRRDLGCVHYHEHLMVKACPFSSMFLYFAERSRKHCMHDECNGCTAGVLRIGTEAVFSVGCSIWFGWVL